MLFLGKSIKTHFYWSMKNCECDADHLCIMIDNHYQVQFVWSTSFPVMYGICTCSGYSTSIYVQCHVYTYLNEMYVLHIHISGRAIGLPHHMPHYTPSEAKLSDPSTIDTLNKTLHTTYSIHTAMHKSFVE